MTIPSLALRLRPTLRSLCRARALAVPAALAVALTASASGGLTYHIKPGDTLSAIALRYHTTVPRLVALNDLPGDGSLIIAGETLQLPGRQASGHPGHGGTHTSVIFHTVTRGDTLDGIAAHFDVKPAVIARRNHLPPSLVVVLGERLAIPHRVASGPAPSSSVHFTAAASHDRDYLARRAEPGRDQISAAIRATSARWGLDPRLALAIAWQESGWNMRAVSPVDAIGAMQVMRYTASYLAADVVHRSLNLYDAQDNITAGVALLSVLTHEARSTRQAVAGYYQGLQSVRAHGMYASTTQYVDNVMSLRQRF